MVTTREPLRSARTAAKSRQEDILTRIPPRTADLIDQLRAGGVILTYDPDTHTIRGGDNSTIAVTTGQNH